MNTEVLLASMNENRQPCMETLGSGTIVLVDRNAELVRIEFTANKAHCHSGNVVQGGFVAGWLDSAMALAVTTRSDRSLYPATLELKTSYLKSAHPGVYYAEGWIEQMGKSVAFLEARLLDTEGTLIAKGSSTARLLVNKVP